VRFFDSKNESLEEKMFARRIRLCKPFGFEVRIDWSWIIIALLIARSLSKGLSPSYYKNLSAQTYWWMGIIAALRLFPFHYGS
jgi:hypothetical protein